MEQAASAPRFGMLRSLVTDMRMHVDATGPDGPTDNIVDIEFSWPAAASDGNVSAALATTLTVAGADDPGARYAELHVRVSGLFADPESKGAALSEDLEFLAAAIDALYQQARVHLSIMAGTSPMARADIGPIDAREAAAELARLHGSNQGGTTGPGA